MSMIVVAAILSLATLTVADPIRVAVLSEHDPGAWTLESNCSTELSECNIRVYEAAIEVAASANASVVVLPEGYGLNGAVTKEDVFEPWLGDDAGLVPCNSMFANQAPLQHALSCAARAANIAVVSNLFVSMESNNTRRIATIVYDRDGSVVVTYFKHELFPVVEPQVFEPGPFKPTVAEIAGRRFGIVICYEGIYPTLSGDWSQIDQLVKTMDSDILAWSVGCSNCPYKPTGATLARHGGVEVAGSENSKSGILLESNGFTVPTTSVPLTAVEGYSADASVLVGEL